MAQGEHQLGTTELEGLHIGVALRQLAELLEVALSQVYEVSEFGVYLCELPDVI